MTGAGPIHVCHLVSDDAWGGAEAVVAGLLTAQSARADLRVRLIALNEGGLVTLARKLGIEATVLPETGRGFATLLREVRARLAAAPPDIVHSHRYKENLLSYLSARRCGARSVVTLHGEEPPAQLARRLVVGARRLVTHAIARRVGARFAAVSSDLRNRLHLSPRRCVVIPNGVRIPQVQELAVQREAGGAFVIGWVGRMVPVKGLSTLLEAIALLPATLGTTRLLLVGDGPDRGRLEALATRSGIADRIEFTGFVEDPAPLRRQMDLFAFPSLHEGIPLALLEAMAVGIPCVAAAVGGIPEVDGGERALRLVETHSPSDWASAIAEFLGDPEGCRALGMRGRARAAARFSLEAVVEEYRELYEAALEARRFNRETDLASR